METMRVLPVRRWKTLLFPVNDPNNVDSKCSKIMNSGENLDL